MSESPGLLREDDWAIFGDKRYVNNSLKHAARKAGVHWGVALKGTSKHKLTAAKRTNHQRTSVRARVGHTSRVIKRQFGSTKVRYNGPKKNAAQVFALIRLTNLYLARRKLLA